MDPKTTGRDTADTLNVGPAVVPGASPAADQVVVPGALSTSHVWSATNGARFHSSEIWKASSIGAPSRFLVTRPWPMPSVIELPWVLSSPVLI